MNELFAAAEHVQQFCSARNWRTCYIGGIAVQRWGDPRQTKDGDLTLITGFGKEEEYVDEFLANFRARNEHPRDFALKNRVLLVYDSSGIPFDIALGGLPFEERTVERASPWQVGSGQTLITCSPEDLIIHKAVAARYLDWADIEKILMRQIKRLNVDLIFKELRPLLQLKEAPEIEDQLREMIEKEKLEN